MRGFRIACAPGIDGRSPLSRFLDIYEPTKVALTHLLPLVCNGGIVVLDEFNYSKFAGETQALKELVDLRDIELRRFSFEPFTAYFRI